MVLSELKINPNNPRKISQDEKAKLKDSINGFEKMLKAHPIVVDENNVILSGNQRYQCLIELDYKQIPDEWVKKVTDFTEQEKKEFMVKMNTHAGSFDYEMFEDEFWDDVEFEEWVDAPVVHQSEVDYSDKNKEIDVDGFEDKMVIKLNYTEDEYRKVKEALLKIAQTPEAALWKLLCLDE